MRRLAQGVPTALGITSYDGIVVARSAFESSIRYRSAVLFGSCSPVAEDKERFLDLVTDALIPGRRTEVRRPTKAELAATLVLALPIEDWSLKVSAGWPEDTEDDLAGPAWAGVVPVRQTYDDPLPAPDLRAGIEVPPSVRELVGRPDSGRQ
jgi:nitroimidazol reductase NimA-like FMN-containing flavoprotein (pyridoxamine 5'-phosphate oxidase superfamily)